jgi:hypothetical protein
MRPIIQGLFVVAVVSVLAASGCHREGDDSSDTDTAYQGARRRMPDTGWRLLVLPLEEDTTAVE